MPPGDHAVLALVNDSVAGLIHRHVSSMCIILTSACAREKSQSCKRARRSMPALFSAVQFSLRLQRRLFLDTSPKLSIKSTQWPRNGRQTRQTPSPNRARSSRRRRAGRRQRRPRRRLCQLTVGSKTRRKCSSCRREALRLGARVACRHPGLRTCTASISHCVGYVLL